MQDQGKHEALVIKPNSYKGHQHRGSCTSYRFIHISIASTISTIWDIGKR